ncbi:MAG: SGNH/GDSL hydrolase family protein [Verrucomicrobia bacterium]|nr:SGNH/GDSL hydrolase family protein [Verrucomicrobiota bacterium]
MKHLISLSLLILVLLPLSSELRGEHEGKVQILLLGDSTTEGSIPRLLQPEGPHLEQVLEKLLAVEDGLPSCRVINSSQSGEYIRRLLDKGRYQKNGAKLPGIDYIFVRYGINDRARIKDFSENFPKDFHELIKVLRKDHPKALIIPTTIIPFSSEEVSKEINDLVRQVAKVENLKVFDIYPGYAKALKLGPNMLNYRRYPLEKIPKLYHEWLEPRVHGGKVVVMGNELDALFSHLPGWTGDRHPNLAGYNVIAVETAKYLIPLLKARKE